MNEQEMNQLVEAWISGAEAEGSPAAEEFYWAARKVMRLKDPEELWQFVLAAYKRPMSEKAQCLFAAAPLEDLISAHGSQFIQRIEELANADPDFKEILGGVWQGRTPEKIWTRIANARGEEWGP